MRPSNNPNSNFKAKDGEQNGTRIYQLMLNSMQILPVADISHIAFFNNRIVDTTSEEQRKADAPINTCPNKKKPTSTSAPKKMTTRNNQKNDAGVPVEGVVMDIK